MKTAYHTTTIAMHKVTSLTPVALETTLVSAHRSVAVLLFGITPARNQRVKRERDHTLAQRRMRIFTVTKQNRTSQAFLKSPGLPSHRLQQANTAAFSISILPLLLRKQILSSPKEKTQTPPIMCYCQ